MNISSGHSAATAPAPSRPSRAALVRRSKRRLQPEFGKIDAQQRTSAQARERRECVSALDAPANLLDKLAPDEKLLWWGRPDAGRFARSYVVPLLVGIGFAAYGLIAAGNSELRDPVLRHTAPDSVIFSFLLALVFAIGGLWSTYVTGRTLLSRHAVAYGLTQNRLIIGTGRWKAKSFGAKAFHKIKRTGRRRDTIWFDYGASGDGDDYNHALFAIPDADRVEELVRQQFPAPKKQKSFWRPFG